MAVPMSGDQPSAISTMCSYSRTIASVSCSQYASRFLLTASASSASYQPHTMKANAAEALSPSRISIPS